MQARRVCCNGGHRNFAGMPGCGCRPCRIKPTETQPPRVMPNNVATSTMVIRRFTEQDSVAELTELLHRAYATLAAMGLRFFATHQTAEQTLERMENGECYVGTVNNRVVATVMYYGPQAAGGAEWYDRPDVASFGQFAVEPELQAHGYGGQMMAHVEACARRDGAAELALDTAESAAHLIAYYSRRGYRHVGHAQWNVTNYRSVIMSKALGGDRASDGVAPGPDAA